MNYVEEAPHTHGFFSNFEYQFSDKELKFLRHAPEFQTQMGGPYYGDRIKDALRAQAPDLKLQTTVRRCDRVFDFLEPVVLDFLLTNRSNDVQLVDASIFANGHNLSVSVVGPDGRRFGLRPFVVRCLAQRRQVLRPGESLRHSAFVSAGAGGWLIGEPGPYSIMAALKTGDGIAEADPLQIRVARPCGREEEAIAQDYFSDEVGQVLALGGTAILDHVHDLLREVAERYAERPFGRHAALALGLPRVKARKLLQLREGHTPVCSVAQDGGVFVSMPKDVEEAKRLLEAALLGGAGDDTFPEIFFEDMLGRVSKWLEREGDREAARRFCAPSAVGKPAALSDL